jgi:ABC-type multidrug transport system fused ATPase/permease subunit
MSNAARQERSVGAIVNHMTTDTEKLQMECLTFHNLWSSPLRICLGLYLLVSALGWSGVIGFVSVLLLLPLQTWVMKKFAFFFSEVLKRSDTRVKVLTEVLGGMRVIKYCKCFS